jgi:hypothetical protein
MLSNKVTDDPSSLTWTMAGGHTAVRIDGREPLGSLLVGAHVQADVVVWKAERISVEIDGPDGLGTEAYPSSSAAITILTGFTDVQPWILRPGLGIILRRDFGHCIADTGQEISIINGPSIRSVRKTVR